MHLVTKATVYFLLTLRVTHRQYNLWLKSTVFLKFLGKLTYFLAYSELLCLWLPGGVLSIQGITGTISIYRTCMFFWCARVSSFELDGKQTPFANLSNGSACWKVQLNLSFSLSLCNVKIIKKKKNLNLSGLLNSR